MEESNLPKQNDLPEQDSQDQEKINSYSITSSQPLKTEEITKENTIWQESEASNPKEGIKPLMEVALEEIKKNRNDLKKEIEELAIKKAQIESEVNQSFIGQSDSIARKVKGFQDYLNGALQDLAQSAEQLELVVQPVVLQPSPLDEISKAAPKEQLEKVHAVSDTFKPDEALIKDCLNQFLEQPDFYAEPWKFRRSLDLRDKELLEDWFFNMGGRGAQTSRGSRAKNVLLASALIAILGELYGDRFQTLILASQPERLGEWRRGLQDALGLSREDFGPNSGIVLFERSDGLVEKADLLEERDEVPLILIDAAELSIDIPILQFPLWLAFAASPEEIYSEEELI
tara:strand:- start:344 stop:1375 length:1032 start_codon:yes stop_codon:yes gene_type:complete